MENYLTDVLNLLIDEASRIKRDVSTEFEMGRLTGYYETISTLLNQAEAFRIAEALPEKLRDYRPEDLFENIRKSTSTEV